MSSLAGLGGENHLTIMCSSLYRNCIIISSGTRIVEYELGQAGRLRSKKLHPLTNSVATFLEDNLEHSCVYSYQPFFLLVSL